MLIFHVFYNTNNTKSLKATFPYWENCRIPSFHRTPDLGSFISAQRAGNGLASESLHGVKQNGKKLVCLSRFGLGLGIEFSAVSIGLSRHAYFKNCSLEKDLRTQASSHSPHIPRNHRTPERASHTIRCWKWFYLFSASTDFFLVFLFHLKCPGIKFFGIWGRWRSHLKRRQFHIRSHSM